MSGHNSFNFFQVKSDFMDTHVDHLDNSASFDKTWSIFHIPALSHMWQDYSQFATASSQQLVRNSQFATVS